MRIRLRIRDRDNLPTVVVRNRNCTPFRQSPRISVSLNCELSLVQQHCVSVIGYFTTSTAGSAWLPTARVALHCTAWNFRWHRHCAVLSSHISGIPGKRSARINNKLRFPMLPIHSNEAQTTVQHNWVRLAKLEHTWEMQTCGKHGSFEIHGITGP